MLLIPVLCFIAGAIVGVLFMVAVIRSGSPSRKPSPPLFVSSFSVPPSPTETLPIGPEVREVDPARPASDVSVG